LSSAAVVLAEVRRFGIEFIDNSEPWEARMQTLKYVHWQEGDAFLGYLVEFPDYWTQGDSLDDLKEHLADLFRDVTSGELKGIRKVDDLVIP
jgi:predicted RNase H-like HicB family nuclease